MQIKSIKEVQAINTNNHVSLIFKNKVGQIRNPNRFSSINEINKESSSVMPTDVSTDCKIYDKQTDNCYRNNSEVKELERDSII